MPTTSRLERWGEQLNEVSSIGRNNPASSPILIKLRHLRFAKVGQSAWCGFGGPDRWPAGPMRWGYVRIPAKTLRRVLPKGDIAQCFSFGEVLADRISPEGTAEISGKLMSSTISICPNELENLLVRAGEGKAIEFG